MRCDPRKIHRFPPNPEASEAWERTRYPPPAPYPAPEVPRRPAVPSEVPRNASALAWDAQTAGWSVGITYARGTRMGARGKPLGVVDSIAVTCLRPAECAIGIWLNGAYEVGWTILRGQGLQRHGWQELRRIAKATPPD